MLECFSVIVTSGHHFCRNPVLRFFVQKQKLQNRGGLKTKDLASRGKVFIFLSKKEKMTLKTFFITIACP